jgi:Leucine-rich repeat (LRR) protein
LETLSLGHLKISKIVDLTHFASLRKLVLLDNKIEQISGLGQLKQLEELNLEKNKIQVI